MIFNDDERTRQLIDDFWRGNSSIQTCRVYYSTSNSNEQPSAQNINQNLDQSIPLESKDSSE